MLSPKIGEFAYTANVATVPVALPAFGDLPEDTQIFVVEYGLKQYIQDGAAVSPNSTPIRTGRASPRRKRRSPRKSARVCKSAWTTC
jgi:hypothetical protein